MKKLLVFIFAFTLFACSNSDDGNTFLPNVPVDETVYLNTHAELQIAGGSTTVPGGIKGIIVYNYDGNQFLAWEAACPHMTPSSCSKMIVQGVMMVCPCDDSKFSILDGSPQSGTQYSARQYRVVKQGSVLYITNF